MATHSHEEQQLLLERIKALEDTILSRSAKSKGRELDCLNITVPPDVQTKIQAGTFISLSLLLDMSFMEQKEEEK